MKTSKKLIFLFALIATPLVSVSQYQVVGDKFTIEFPIEPEHSSEHFNSEDGGFILQSYIAEDLNHNSMFGLFYIDYPEELYYSELIWADEYDLLMIGAKAFVDDIGMKLVADESVNFEETEAMVFFAENETEFCIGLMFFIENRMYQAILITTGDYAEVEEYDPFFSSLKLK